MLYVYFPVGLEFEIKYRTGGTKRRNEFFDNFI